MPHLIELSKTYQLGVTDAGYVVYQLELDSDINLKRNKENNSQRRKTKDECEKLKTKYEKELLVFRLLRFVFKM